MFQKLRVSIFSSCPYKRPTTAVEGVERRGMGPPLQPTTETGERRYVVSSHSGVWSGALAANDFGAFRVQFYAILCIF